MGKSTQSKQMSPRNTYLDKLSGYNVIADELQGAFTLTGRKNKDKRCKHQHILETSEAIRIRLLQKVKTLSFCNSTNYNDNQTVLDQANAQLNGLEHFRNY